MKILFIGPLPDPVTGHSLACKVFLDFISKSHEVIVVNLSTPILTSGYISTFKVVFICKSLYKIWRARKTVDSIYFTISESVAGNIKDLLIYLICYSKLSSLVVHLHGGSIKTWIFDKFKLLRALNAYFLARVSAVVVLGESHIPIFADMVPKDRIYIVPNFALDELFTSEIHILEKHADINVIRVLFLSNLISGKGYEQILNAYFALQKSEQDRYVIDFAGAFESESDKLKFLQAINGNKNIHYHGVVAGLKKKELLEAAHVFCLPTSLLEGQPISILEAYAAGCTVVTTLCGGIRDIFSDQVNGFKIYPHRPDSLRDVFIQILNNPSDLLPIALKNYRDAKTLYRPSRYSQDLSTILEHI